jgi:predicted HTH domain antitoxin
MGLLIRARDLVQARLYENEDQVMQEAFRFFVLERPGLRLQVAIHQYRTDETLSLARAAAIAGVSTERMKEILDRHGVPLRLGPATIAEAQAEAATVEEWLCADSH